MKNRIILLAGLVLVDVITTWAGLALGGTEANPAMVAMVSNPWIHAGLKGCILVFMVAALELSFRSPEAARFRSRGYCMVGSVYLVVLLSNVVQITAMALC